MKINFEKTNAVCFGSLKYCCRKYSSVCRIVWDPGILKILGKIFFGGVGKYGSIIFW